MQALAGKKPGSKALIQGVTCIQETLPKATGLEIRCAKNGNYIELF